MIIRPCDCLIIGAVDGRMKSLLVLCFAMYRQSLTKHALYVKYRATSISRSIFKLIEPTLTRLVLTYDLFILNYCSEY